MLPEIVDAAKGQAEIYLDSGIRRGSDVIKALALGARAVAIGRPLFWGLAVNGHMGVHGVLELLREEVDRALAYCGQTSVQDLEPNLINIPTDGVRVPGWLPSRVQSRHWAHRTRFGRLVLPIGGWPATQGGLVGRNRRFLCGYPGEKVQDQPVESFRLFVMG